MSSISTSRAALADADRRAAETVGATSTAVRGADWRMAIVDTVNADGTVLTTDGITARRLESYRDPLVGDQIIVTISSSGNWLAAGRTATSSHGLGTVLFKRKPAATGPRTSATPSADPHLSVSLSPNSTYTLDAFAKWSGDSASDMNWGWSVPSGAAGSWVAYADATSLSAVPSTVRNIDTGIGSPRSYGAIATVIGIAMRGTVRTGASGGTFGVEWSSQTAGGTGVTVYEDTWIRLEKRE